MGAHGTYYVPKPSHWPLVGSIGLTTTLVGAASWLHHDWYGPYIFTLGLAILVFMMFGWFGQVIYENEKGLYDLQVDRSFRWGMSWFIFSEVCFFGAFFQGHWPATAIPTEFLRLAMTWVSQAHTSIYFA